jgi:hypothetical protein
VAKTAREACAQAPCSSAAVLQLAISFQDITAAVAELKAVGHQRSAAAEQVAPGHAAAAIAESRGRRSAGCQVIHVEGRRDGAGEAEEKETDDDLLHPRPLLFVWTIQILDRLIRG